MKIVMISDLYPPNTMGGYEISCMVTSNELRRRGHDITILTSIWGADQSLVEENIHRLLFFNEINHQLILRANDPFRLRRRYYQILWAFKNRINREKTYQFLASRKPDLVIFWNMASMGVGSILAAQELKIPRVFNIGDDWLISLKKELYFNPIFIKRKFNSFITGVQDYQQLEFDHILVNSQSLKQAHIRNGFPEETIHVIPRGIHSELILPISKLNDLPHKHNKTVKLLYIGRIVPEKAPDVAIKTIAILKQLFGIQNVKLDIIGIGPAEYIFSLKRMVTEMDLEENVAFIDWMDFSLLFDTYREHDMLLFPSRWEEPFGRTVMEAMSQGLPVISTRYGGPLDIIRDGENGLFVPVDDAQAFAKAVIKLLQNDELTQKIRISALRTINERYTLEFVVDQNIDYLQGILVSEKLSY
jgi:glycosyltransferase involved in cell wall biosynthesis